MARLMLYAAFAFPLTLGGMAEPVPTLQFENLAFRERDGIMANAPLLEELGGGALAGFVKVNGRIDGPRGVNLAIGHHAGSSAAKAQSGFPNLYVSGIEAKDRILCIEVISIDGLYEANGIVQVSDTARAAGSARIVLPSKNQRLRKSSQVEIAPLVRASESVTSCKRSDPILSSAWGGLVQGKQPTILLGGNGSVGRPTIRRLADTNAAACTEVPSEGRSLAGYRFMCRPLSAACSASETYAVGWRSGANSAALFQFTLRNKC